jgi:hypothetical protein
MKVGNLTSNLLNEIINTSEYKIQTLMVNYSAQRNAIKYLTGMFIGVVAIFILFMVSFDISRLYKFIVKKFHKIHKPKSVNPTQNFVFNNFNNFYKINEIDRRYLKFIKKYKK